MRARLGTLALSVAAILLTLLAAEAVLRVTQALHEPPPPEPPVAIPPGFQNLTSLKHLIRPNVRGYFKGSPYRTNSRGVRGPEYAPEAPPGVFRIVVIGDSYTMGQGVLENETYPAVTERLLSRPDRPVQVINLGISGLAIRHSIRRLRKVGLDYQPHLVVYGFTPNDILGPHYQVGTPEDKRWMDALAQRFDGSPSRLLRMVWPRLVMARSGWSALPGTYEYTLETNYFRNPEALRQITDGLDDLRGITRSLGICGHVFVHTRLNQLFVHPFTRVYDLVAELARERGLTAHAALPSFRWRDARKLRLSDADTHPNPAGHRLHAESLASALEALPPHCWRPPRYRPPAPAAAR